MEKVETEIGVDKVKEGKEVKTLGVIFYGYLRFEKYWKDTKNKIMKKMYAISQVKSDLTFLQRK